VRYYRQIGMLNLFSRNLIGKVLSRIEAIVKILTTALPRLSPTLVQNPNTPLQAVTSSNYRRLRQWFKPIDQTLLHFLGLRGLLLLAKPRRTRGVIPEIELPIPTPFWELGCNIRVILNIVNIVDCM